MTEQEFRKLDAKIRVKENRLKVKMAGLRLDEARLMSLKEQLNLDRSTAYAEVNFSKEA